MATKIIKYPISANYMAHWGLREAVRELLQNAIDSGAYMLECLDNVLTITNELAEPLSIDTLTLLGESSKHDGTTIGKFGEGFKLALLVLARAKIDHVVAIGHCCIRGRIVDNKFEITIKDELPIVQTKMEVSIDSADAYDIACNMLVRKADFKEIASTVNARAFTPGGTLFVGGLKVCDNTGMKYSYDLSPKDVQLERDRNTVRSFELAWAASKFWVQQQVTKDLVADIFNNVPDVEYIITHGPSKELLDAIYDHYLEFYGPEAVLAETQEKAKAFAHLYHKVQYVGRGAYYSMVTSHKLYHSAIKEAKRVKPSEAVQSFVTENMKHMRSKAKRAAKKLQLSAAHW